MREEGNLSLFAGEVDDLSNEHGGVDAKLLCDLLAFVLQVLCYTGKVNHHVTAVVLVGGTGWPVRL